MYKVKIGKIALEGFISQYHLKSKTGWVLFLFIISLFFISYSSEAREKEQIKQYIDAHIHLYDTTRSEGVPWPPKKNDILYRPFKIEDFRNVIRDTCITHTIVVEASHWKKDNDWLLNHIKDAPEVLGIIGNLDPEEDSFKEDLHRLSQNRKFLGIRLRKKPSPDFIEKTFLSRLGAMAEYGLTLEFIVPRYPIQTVALLARKYPELRIVIDHLAGVRIRNNQIKHFTASPISLLSGFSNVYCKLSAFYGGIGQKPAPTEPEVYFKLIETVVKVFGPKRVFFGTNWPVSELRGKYRTMPRVLQAYCAKTNPEWEEMFFRINTLRAYGLNDMGKRTAR